MAITASTIVQPALGEITSFFAFSDPILKIDDTISFYGYGIYKVVGIGTQTPFDGEYDIQLLSRYNNAPPTIPIGTAVSTQTESLAHSTKPYTATTFLNFADTSYQSMVVTGNITLAAQRHAPGRSIAVRLINNNSVAKTLSFPGSWTFLGVKPSTLAGSKTGVLSLTCFEGSTGNPATASDADVIAVWATS